MLQAKNDESRIVDSVVYPPYAGLGMKETSLYYNLDIDDTMDDSKKKEKVTRVEERNSK